MKNPGIKNVLYVSSEPMTWEQTMKLSSAVGAPCNIIRITNILMDLQAVDLSETDYICNSGDDLSIKGSDASLRSYFVDFLLMNDVFNPIKTAYHAVPTVLEWNKHSTDTEYSWFVLYECSLISDWERANKPVFQSDEPTTVTNLVLKYKRVDDCIEPASRYSRCITVGEFGGVKSFTNASGLINYTMDNIMCKLLEGIVPLKVSPFSGTIMRNEDPRAANGTIRNRREHRDGLCKQHIKRATCDNHKNEKDNMPINVSREELVKLVAELLEHIEF